MTTLFDPFNLSGLELRNRVVMAPMTRSRAADTVPDAATATYYQQRATAGLIITEGSQISDEGRGYLFTPGMHTPAQGEGWKAVTDAVHARDGVIFTQIWHVGRVSHVSVQTGGRAPVSSVAKVAEGTTAFAYDEQGQPGPVQASMPRALETAEIPRITQDFVAAAHNAVAAGFDGVEVHGANGYLLEQFINAGLNTRDDHYGGATIEDRLRFTLETVDAVTAAIGPGRVGIRLSPFNRIFDMPAFDGEADTWLELARQLASRKLAYVHVSNRDVLVATDEGRRFLEAFRQAYDGTLIIAGGYTRETAEADVSAGLTDLAAFGRPFISNPDLVARLQNGWRLAEPDRNTFYGGTTAGYTDYPEFVGEEVLPAS
ncbi:MULTISPECIES: alkene reductase [unclassified Luteimonas]